jgi:5,10-methylene-tetrahydrofolate dehydrogenase/methenyl tetrahydrofolate cyclohydrolase
MTARIIDGKARALRLTEEIKVTVAARVAAGMPRRACRRAGRRQRRVARLRAQQAATTEAVGMRSFAHDLPADAEEEDLLTSSTP